MEGEDAQLQKVLYWLGAGMPRTLLSGSEISLADEVRSPAALACSHQAIKPLRGHTVWPSELALGYEPNAGLGHPMPMLMGLVLVQVYIRNWLVTHLFKLLVKWLVVAGLCPMCWSSKLFIFKLKFASRVTISAGAE